VIFVLLSLKFRKTWMLYLTACQLCGLLVRIFAHYTAYEFKSYATVVGVFGGWGLLIALAVGTWECEVRRRKGLPLD
jgi:hypothetical protein